MSGFKEVDMSDKPLKVKIFFFLITPALLWIQLMSKLAGMPFEVSEIDDENSN